MTQETRVEGTVVVGLGGIGSAAAYHLAARGEKVLGLDPRAPGHRDGSSHGRTRLVRQAYFENPAYVPLTRAAWRLWHELEHISGEHLLTATGVLEIAQIDDPDRLVPATLTAAALHGLPIEHLTAADLRRRFPALKVDDTWEGAFEQDAGFVDPEATIRAHHRLARDAGADLRTDEVVNIQLDEDTPLIHTTRAAYRADRVVVAAGPWAPELLAVAGLGIESRRKVVAHFAPGAPETVGANALPGFAISAGHLYYGFPNLEGQGVKIGRHDGGELCTPASIDRTVHADEVSELQAVLARFLPDAAGPEIDSYTCMYTMSVDEDFIIGALPNAPSCIVATGCSGHAFKFVPVLGEILADLALGVTPAYDIRFLAPDRQTQTPSQPVHLPS